MYKKKVLAILFVAVITIFTTYNVYQSQKVVKVSDLMMANVEALANSREIDGRCDNSNGYRRILEGDERIYDCCYEEKIGKGKEDCNRW